MERQVSEKEKNIIDFAMYELERYRAFMDKAADRGEAGIKVGLFADLLPERPVPANPFDDEIYIQLEKGRGVIAGANPRSCLLAVYRLLQEAGCRFLRPGPQGELVPQLDWSSLTVTVDEKPSYRHRGLCIEGAVSREVFLNIIDWLPKNGLNAYFIQFREGFTFFDRWYDHKSNPFVPSEAKTIDQVRQIMDEGVAQIAKRGLIYHAVGHGWTCEPLGIPGTAWEEVKEIPAGVSQYFAELDGKRELFRGIPLNTNLCYGNAKVRDLIVQDIVGYAKEHPHTDLIHFWLADGTNNQCECTLCRDTRPADFYVAMLNQLDEELARENLPHKIVFLIYVDLLWQPEKETIKNPERFVLMFAPITRSYSQAFKPTEEKVELPPYVRNRLTFPSSASANLAFLEPWQELAGGERSDSFDFDYHMMWDHFKDPGYEVLAEVLHADLQNLSALGLAGLISCQVQRVFFPSPLLMQVVAKTLWNKKISLTEIATDTYKAAFGPDWARARQLLQEVSAVFNPPWLRLELPLVNEEQSSRLDQAQPLAKSIADLAEKNLDLGLAPSQHRSWRLLLLFSEYIMKLAVFAKGLAQGDYAGAREGLARLLDWVFLHEPELLHVFDSEIMHNTFKGILAHLEAEQAG